MFIIKLQIFICFSLGVTPVDAHNSDTAKFMKPGTRNGICAKTY